MTNSGKNELLENFQMSDGKTDNRHIPNKTGQGNVTSATSCTVSSSIVDISTKHLPATIPRKTP